MAIQERSRQLLATTLFWCIILWYTKGVYERSYFAHQFRYQHSAASPHLMMEMSFSTVTQHPRDLGWSRIWTRGSLLLSHTSRRPGCIGPSPQPEKQYLVEDPSCILKYMKKNWLWDHTWVTNIAFNNKATICAELIDALHFMHFHCVSLTIVSNRKNWEWKTSNLLFSNTFLWFTPHF